MWTVVIVVIFCTTLIMNSIKGAQVVHSDSRSSLSLLFARPHSALGSRCSEVFSYGDFDVFSDGRVIQLTHRFLFHCYTFAADSFHMEQLASLESIMTNLSTQRPSLASTTSERDIARVTVFSFAMSPESRNIFPYHAYDRAGSNGFYRCHVAETSIFRAVELLLRTNHFSYSSSTDYLIDCQISPMSYVVCAYVHPPRQVTNPVAAPTPNEQAVAITQTNDASDDIFIDTFTVEQGFETQGITEAMVIQSGSSPNHTIDSDRITWWRDDLAIRVSAEVLELQSPQLDYIFRPNDPESRLMAELRGFPDTVVYITANDKTFSDNINDHVPGNHFCAFIFGSQEDDGWIQKIESVVNYIGDKSLGLGSLHPRDFVVCVKTGFIHDHII